MPDAVRVSIAADGTFDVVQLFARDKATLDQFAGTALGAVAPNGRLWISFPKGSSKIQTDLTRDSGWDVVTTAEQKFMSLISVNEIWSAARFNPAVLIAQANRKPNS